MAISMEIGVHNETLAITMAIAVLSEPRLAVPAALYALVKFAVIPLFGCLSPGIGRRRQRTT